MVGPKQAVKIDGRVARAERQRRERREKVLLAARRVFAEKGYHAASISDIIAAAGIARGTFYLYFVSKRAIFAELLDHFFAHMTREVRQVDVSPGAKPPRDQLHAIVRHTLSTLVENRDLTRILLREAVGLDDDFDRKLQDFYGRLLAVIGHALETGQRFGIVRECDIQVASHCVLGSVKELADHLLLESTRGGAFDLDAITREALDFNLSGVFRVR